MKKLTFYLTLVFLYLSLQQGWSQNKIPVLEVYYFHATNRCATCNSIEANTKKTLETHFSKQLKAGNIKFTVLNSDDEKNKAICEKFEAYGATLILSKSANGKEAIENLTNFAFSYSRNQPTKFIEGLKVKIDEMLK